ncbi:hypothetical protein FRACYDRAFT_270929 [Fragilariopsis cylindrus CCMP1102]|uniref:Uncharacterized protein n=1 Tax=Fragilariopsis cylindrus CCMP1102 TaxID=635003 RepID=A0A1E7EZA9_9STRA|nr:hypothetical protein FRACYDRAFT_270929 [Fragilariopsis cylindrus CCMP1102]|eukprot:OEU11164.1 hypothetical protein FRACYDRAFT_270929 [Fragilariopsis cylindrus CCMP1102]
MKLSSIVASTLALCSLPSSTKAEADTRQNLRHNNNEKNERDLEFGTLADLVEIFGVPREADIKAECTPVGQAPYQYVVYTAVTYTDEFFVGSPYDFSDVSSLVSLEANFTTAYNQETGGCPNYENASKEVKQSLVLAANLSNKQYLLGSQVISNAFNFVCGTNNAAITFSGNFDQPGAVPELFRYATNNNNNNDEPNDQDQCACDGPLSTTFANAYDTLLLSS